MSMRVSWVFLLVLAGSACGGDDQGKGGKGTKNKQPPPPGEGGVAGVVSRPGGSPSRDGGGPGASASQGGQAGTGREAAGASGQGGSSEPLEDPRIGEPCTLAGDCAAGELCFQAPGVQALSCRRACLPTEVGSRGSCASGELCVLSLGGDKAACHLPCAPFDDEPGCGMNDRCVANPPAALVGDSSPEGLCLYGTVGSAGRGEPCADGCGLGLVCYEPELGRGRCEPACSLEAEGDAPGTCPSGEECRPAGIGAGACIKGCDPLGENPCGEDRWCAPFEHWEGSRAVVAGQCVTAGPKEEGEECADLECGVGLLCSSPPSEYPGPALCRPFCAPEARPICEVGQCIAELGPHLDLGSCVSSCTVFREGPEAGCEDDEWCAPLSEDPEVGTCTSQGPNEAGGPCASHADCAAGHYCDCRFGANASCQNALKDPDAPDGPDNLDPKLCLRICRLADPMAEQCPEAQRCVPLQGAGASLGYGACREACDFAAGTACSDELETCTPGALLGSEDVCLDSPPWIGIGEECDLASFDLGDPCHESGRCGYPDPNGALACLSVP